MSEREKIDVGEEGERYKYPPEPQQSLKSWQCRTRQDRKGKSEVLAVLAE